MSYTVIGFVGYLFVLLGVGFFAYRLKPIRSLTDFILGTRFGAVLTALSHGATLASGYAYIGLVGMGYTLGAPALWQAIFPPILELVAWMAVAKRVRRYTGEKGILTPIEMIADLKGDPGNLIKIIGGLTIGVFMFAYVGGNVMAGAKAAAVLEVPYSIAIVGVTVVVVIYTLLGGMTAVVWTDALQGALMIAGLVFIPILALIKVGGVGAFFSELGKLNPLLIKWHGGKSGYALFTNLILWMGIAVGFLAQPQGLQRFITITSERDVPKAAFASVTFNAIRQYCPIIIGLSARILFGSLDDPEMVVPKMIQTYMPGLFGGVMLAMIFAAIMSTTDSLLIQGSAEISRSVMQLSLWRNASPECYSAVSKIVTVAIGIGALLTALYTKINVFYIVIFAFAGLAAAVGPAVYMGFYWRRTTSWGILASIVVGMASTVVWASYFKKTTGLHEGLPGFLLGVIALVVVSLLAQKTRSEDACTRGAMGHS